LRILNLIEDSEFYTSNVYLILGSWNTIDDVNTLIDVGNDLKVIAKINQAPTGVGKKRIKQVILTHCHYDHSGILPEIRENFNPTIYAFAPGKYIDKILKDGQQIKIADSICEVIYTPGHSHDSISLYCKENGVLFVGDTPVKIRDKNNNYEEAFIKSLEKLGNLEVKDIYFGHGEPVLQRGDKLIQESLHNIKGKIATDRL